MKTGTRISIFAMMLAATAGVAHGQNQPMPPAPLPPGYTSGGSSGITLSRDGAGTITLSGEPIAISAFSTAKEKGSYLGVSISPVSPELRSQIGLAAGFGLVIDSVSPKSPADAAGVKQYDVLTRLNDQQLVDAQQLTVLVRSKRPGDSVDLSVIRQGKPLKLTVKIAEGEVPVQMDAAADQLDRALRDAAPGVTSLPMPGLILENQAAAPGQPRRMSVRVLPFSGTPAAPWQTGGSVRVLQDSDGGLTFLFIGNQGSTRLMIYDRDNHPLFDGPMDTAKDRSHISAVLNKKLSVLMQKNNLQMDDIFSHDKPDAQPATQPSGAGI